MFMKLLMVFIYLAVLLGIGFVASKRMKTMRDYFAADKTLGFISAAFSARATGESAWLLLGLTGMGAALGMKSIWVVIGEIVGVGGAWLFMSQRFKRLSDTYDAITVPDYLEGRFKDSSQLLRIVASFSLVVFVTIYVSAQIDATGTAFESFLGWNYFVGALVGFAIVIAYTVAGGFVAVVWSDVFQGTLMVVGLVTLPIVGLVTLGGFAEMTRRLEAIDPNLLLWLPGDNLGIAIASTMSLALIGLGFLGSPQIFVRFLALKSTDEIPSGTALALVWTVAADTGAVLTGMVGRALLTAPEEPLSTLGNGGQNVLPQLVEHVFPLVIVGLFIAVVLAAIMSTVDSLLVVAGSAAVRDWYQKVRHPHLSDESLVATSRKVTLVLALIALAIALGVSLLVPGRTVFWFVIFGWSGIAATFCPTMILSLFWRGMTKRGALVAMGAGFLAVPLFKFGAPLLPGAGPYFGALSELPPAFALSGLLGVSVSLLDKRNAAPLRRELDLDG